MFMGNTGAGKSTIVNGVVLGSDKIRDNEDGSYEVAKEDMLRHNNRTMFRIGHKASSCTACPGFYPLESKGKKVYFVDCPGFSDNNRNMEYPNRTVVHKIMQAAKTVRVALVINYNELIARRGEYALEVMTTISRLFTDFKKDDTILVVPLLNQVSEQDAQVPMVDFKF